jgi:hypothetical protein
MRIWFFLIVREVYNQIPDVGITKIRLGDSQIRVSLEDLGFMGELGF